MNELTESQQQILDAVRDGADTTNDIAEALDLSKGHTQKVLKRMAEEGHLDRVQSGNGFRYVDPAESDDATPPGLEPYETDEGIMPVNRRYDWDDPDYHADPADYYDTNGLFTRLTSQIKHRRMTDTAVRSLIEGDTGTGKTLLAETAAAWNESREDVVWISIQFSKGTDDGDLLGVPSFAGGDTVWVDGTLTKAFLAASDGKTVHLHLDEFNRAPAHVHNALFEALDHRGAIRLDGPRGGELIQVDPLDVIVTATINDGDEYHGTERLDLAAKGRFTSKFKTQYLARRDPNHPDADSNGYVGLDDEAQLLVERKGVPVDLAKRMILATADVRRDSADASNTTVDWGVPTRAVLAWGGLTRMYAEDGIANPVIQAAEDAVIRPYYGDDSAAGESVRSTIESHLDGAPVDPQAYESWAADESVVCSDCGWNASKPEAEQQGVLATMECPDCGAMDSLNVRSK